MFHLQPPAGAPVPFTDIVRALSARLNYADCQMALEDRLREHSQQRHCYFVDSGKTALLCGLRTLKKLKADNKDEIVIPAYTCFTVAAAVVKSGLKVHPVDIDPMTMDYRYERLEAVDFSKVLAVLGGNLFGIPSDWSKLRSLAREKGVYLIDDSAQTMGSEHEGEPLGGFGDFGFYSLGRGKNLSAYSGGILMTNHERLSELVAQEIGELPEHGCIYETALVIKLILLNIFLHPRLYWIPAGLPFLKLGETVYDPAFDSRKLSRFQVCLTEILLKHLHGYQEQRRQNSRVLIEGISRLPHYRIPGANRPTLPAYLRLPLLAESGEARNLLIGALKKRGISASPMYPSSIHRIAGIGKHLTSASDDFPGADAVAEKLVTLPTHPYLKQSDIERIVATVAEM